VDYGSFWLSKTPEEPGSKSWDSSLTRIATHVKFFHPASGKFVHYFNTHFDHKGEEARRESAALLGSRVAALTDGAPVIVTGDFNATGDTSAPWTTLTTTGALTDAWTTTPERVGPVSTWCGFKAPDPAATNRIDWILFSNGVQVKRCETVVRAVDGRYPSDHFPVVADLVLPW
jgi:endonuclease/exonuclease/phosphatase family metal-dependent hydrolase